MKKIFIFLFAILSFAIYTEEKGLGIRLPFPGNAPDEVEEVEEEYEVIEYVPDDSPEESSGTETLETKEEVGTNKEDSEAEKLIENDKEIIDNHEKEKLATDELKDSTGKKLKAVKKKKIRKVKKVVSKKESIPIKKLSTETIEKKEIINSEKLVEEKSSTDNIASLNPEINKNNLPNLKPKKKGKDSEKDNMETGPYPRGNYHLNRNDARTAVGDYNLALSNEGTASSLSKLELIRLLAKERKTQQAKNLIEGLEDLDTKFKGYFELASGLENSAKTKAEKEESLNIYLYILTELPRENPKNPGEPNPLLAKTSFATGFLLYKLEDYLPALDHLSTIILKHKNSEYLPSAIYLTGKIYEEGTSGKVRNLERAIKFYKMFLDNKTNPLFQKNIYRSEVEKRYKNLVKPS